MCFLPRSYRLPRQKLLHIFNSTWKLSFPNLIIACDVGSAHPLQLGTTELASLTQFREWVAAAREHHAVREGGGWEGGRGSGGKRPPMRRVSSEMRKVGLAVGRGGGNGAYLRKVFDTIVKRSNLGREVQPVL